VLHYAGYPCDLEAVSEIAERHGLVVIEDSAHAPGASVAGRKCGTFGAAGCFSFFSNKNLPVGEGGLFVTDDEELYRRARLLRSHGMTTLTWDRHRGHASEYDVTLRGFNFRLDELRATIGRVQLARLDEENASRRRLVGHYRRLLEAAGLAMPFGGVPTDVCPSFHLAVAVFDSAKQRESARALLAAEGIQTSVHYPPIHRFTAYSSEPKRVPLSETESVATRVLTLPLYGHMSQEQVDLVAEVLVDAVGTPLRGS